MKSPILCLWVLIFFFIFIVRFNNISAEDDSPTILGPTKKASDDEDFDFIPFDPNSKSDPLPGEMNNSPFRDSLVDGLYDSNAPEKSFDRAVEVSKGDLAWSLKTFKGMEPDQAKRVSDLAKKYYGSNGTMTFDIVGKTQQDLEDFEKTKSFLQDITKTNDKGEQLYPLTSKWMTDPVKAAMSRDDVKSLHTLEDEIRNRRRVAWGGNNGYFHDKTSRIGESIGDVTLMSLEGIASKLKSEILQIYKLYGFKKDG